MSSEMQHDPWQVETEDRRADPRTATEFDAHLALPDGLIHGVVVNISFGGAKFVTRTVSPVLGAGSRVTLVVAPRPEAETGELSWNGAVVRAERSGDDGPERIAYAISFEEASRGDPGQGFLG